MTSTRLKKLRVARGYTQIQMQLLTGIDQSDYSKIETGRRYMTYEQCRRIALALEHQHGLSRRADRLPGPLSAANVLRHAHVRLIGVQACVYLSRWYRKFLCSAVYWPTLSPLPSSSWSHGRSAGERRRIATGSDANRRPYFARQAPISQASALPCRIGDAAWPAVLWRGATARRRLRCSPYCCCSRWLPAACTGLRCRCCCLPARRCSAPRCSAPSPPPRGAGC